MDPKTINITPGEATAPAAQLIITVMQNGQIAVNGPLQDKLLCYGLLESARDIVRDFKVPNGGIVVPNLRLS